jgi:hypothetical protein
VTAAMHSPDLSRDANSAYVMGHNDSVTSRSGAAVGSQLREQPRQRTFCLGVSLSSHRVVVRS